MKGKQMSKEETKFYVLPQEFLEKEKELLVHNRKAKVYLESLIDEVLHWRELTRCIIESYYSDERSLHELEELLQDAKYTLETIDGKHKVEDNG